MPDNFGYPIRNLPRMNIKQAINHMHILRIAKEKLQYTFPYAFKPGKEFYEWYNFIDKSQWWPEDQLAEYQWNKLKSILIYSNENIPFYKEMFRNLGYNANDIKQIDDFRKIPFLTKELLREHANEILPSGEDRSKIIQYNTGGSTGIPLPIFKKRIDDTIEEAFMSSQWARVGYKPKDSRVIIRGEVIANKQLWKFHPSSNSWLFSSYHLSQEYIPQMVNMLNVIKPKFLHVYPSSLWVFANLIRDYDLKLSFVPKAILCGSEKLFDHQRKLFKEVFGCSSYSWLGLAEQTILAGECEYNTDLHIFPQHSFIELIDDSGIAITKPGITGHIVGTNLNRYSFPLIRYISGDMAQYAEGPCKCGRHFKRFKQVEGRVQNMVISLDGRIIPLTALVFGQHLQAFNKIEKMQMEQFEPGKVQVKLIKGANFNTDDVDFLLQQLTNASENTIQFSISFHDELERTSSGKHKFMIQHLNINYYNFDQNT